MTYGSHHVPNTGLPSPFSSPLTCHSTQSSSAKAKPSSKQASTNQHHPQTTPAMSASNAPGHQSSQQADPAIEKLVREQKSLKAKIDVLEAENKALKKSLFELSYIYSAQLGSSNHQFNSNNTNSASRPLNNDNNNSGISGDLYVPSTTTSLPHAANNAFNAVGSHHNDMVLAVGQLLSNMSAAQQSHGAETASPNPAKGSDAASRGTDAQLKTATDLIKVEEDGVRRLNMGNIGE